MSLPLDPVQAGAVVWTDAARKKVHPARPQTDRAISGRTADRIDGTDTTATRATASRKPARPRRIDRGKLLGTVAKAFDKYDRGLWKRGEAHADADHARWMRAALLTVASPAKAARATSLDLREQAALAAMLPRGSRGMERVCAALIAYWVDVAGAAFAVEALAISTTIDIAHDHRTHARGVEQWSWLRDPAAETSWLDRKQLRHALRAFLAAADDATFAAAHNAASRIRTSAGPVARRSLAYAFPDEPSWSAEEAAVWLESGTEPSGYGLLASLRDLTLADRILERAIQDGGHLEVGNYVWNLVENLGTAAAPGLGRLLASVIAGDVNARDSIDPDPREATAEALALIDTPEAATALAAALDDKTVRPILAAYAARAPRSAAIALSPIAAGRGKTADAAKALLASITRAHPEAAQAAASSLPERERAAVDALRDRAAAPLNEATPDEIPPELTASADGKPTAYANSKLTASADSKPTAPANGKLTATADIKLPAYVIPSALPRPLLAGRQRALPIPAVARLCAMLASQSPALKAVAAALDPASLADFAWALFEAWQLAGMPPDGLAFEALRAFGDDAIARRLAPLVRAWPGEGGSARAQKALSVFEAIGTDAALLELFQIGEKVKFRALRQAAQLAIEGIAQRRGITRDDLGDRLVPDFGLDASGSRVLDFGARSFRVGFDAELRPYVLDASGKRLANLPKPAKADDPQRAAEATAAWRDLKAGARAVLTGQIARLEVALRERRRWDAGMFRAHIAGHPLVGSIARRLCWGVYDDRDRLTHSFRLSEDGTPADVSDARIELPQGAKVGLVHPIELSRDVLARWGEIFGDYQIVQPFLQLGRPVYTWLEDEPKSRVLKRVVGREVPAGKVMGLERRGWARGFGRDAGIVSEIWRELEGGAYRVELRLEPGLYIGMIAETPPQTLGEVVLERASRESRSKGARLGELHPVTFSELVADLESLST